MRVTFQMSGGLGAFPGLSKPVALDTSTLLATDAQLLERLVQECCFFERAEPAPKALLHDARSYLIEIDTGDRKRVVRLNEPVPNELAPLVHHLVALARKRRR